MTPSEIVKVLKEWWWLATLCLGALVFTATLPARLRTVEAGVKEVQAANTKQDLMLERLTTIAEQNDRREKRDEKRAPNQAAPRVWIEPDLVDGQQVCTDGQQRWWYDNERGCE